jgi:heterodisulfide reductase subunit D
VRAIGRCVLGTPRPYEYYEIVGLSMGLDYDDSFKRLKIMQDADAILADCADLVQEHGLDREATRAAIQNMLDEQRAPLRGDVM